MFYFSAGFAPFYGARQLTPAVSCGLFSRLDGPSTALRDQARRGSENQKNKTSTNPIKQKIKEMSYKNKKLKKVRFNQLKRSIGLIKIALWKKIKVLLPKRKETAVLKQTVFLMQDLRLLAERVRENNKKIQTWVDKYIEECILVGKPVQILTQWCFSLDFEVRLQKQGGKFAPTKTERELVFKWFPTVLEVFEKRNVPINWIVTFNRSYLDSGRLEPETERAYQEMVQGLFDEAGLSSKILLCNWEDDVLLKKPEPDKNVLENLGEFLVPAALQIVFNQHKSWALGEAGLKQADEELWQDVKFQIACEAEEGRFLCDSEESPLSEGKFILVPLEVAERYNPTFLILNPEFEERIASLLPPYPWRMTEE